MKNRDLPLSYYHIVQFSIKKNIMTHFHSSIDSKPTEANLFPSGLNETEMIFFICPFRSYY